MMKKILINGKTYVALSDVKNELKHALRPPQEENTKDNQEIYEALIQDINQTLR